ncbi:peptidylprolyl isomerase [Alkalilimnicola ehrlichii]|nr:peptidylprolyl isomerase [Alkalilimnicola ehrlichii]
MSKNKQSDIMPMNGMGDLKGMLKRTVLALGIVLVLAACSRGGDEDAVARIGDKTISEAEFSAHLDFKRIPADDARRREAALQQYVEREALATVIEQSDVLDRAAIQAELNEFRQEMLISRYFQAFLNDRVTEEAIESYYLNNADNYQHRQVRVAHILQRTHSGMDESERQAKLTTLQEAYSKLRAGADFAELVQQYSEDQVSAAKGGDLGWLREGTISTRFSEVAFNTPAGELSEPFETPFGFHIVKVLESPMTVKQPLEAVRGNIRHQLRNQAREAELERLLGEIEIETAD